MRAVSRDLTCMHDLCGAEGLRSDLRVHVCSCRHGSMARRMDGQCDTGIQILPPCRLEFRPSQDLSAGMPSRQHQKRRAHIPPLVLRLLPEGRRRRWLANQSTSPAAYCTKRRIRPSCFGFKFCMPGPRRSSNLVPILGTLIDVRGSTFELALQLDRSVPPGPLGAVPCCVDFVASGHLPLPPGCFVAETSCLCVRGQPTVAGLILKAL